MEKKHFKFNPKQWLSGKITLETMEIQGVFINVCCMYWSQQCNIKIEKLRLSYGEGIDKLIESGIIKDNEGMASIQFLDEQIKVKKISSIKEVIDIPTQEVFLKYCLEILKEKYKPLEFSLKAKYDKWLENNWKTGYDVDIINWKNTIRGTIPYLKPDYSVNNNIPTDKLTVKF